MWFVAVVVTVVSPAFANRLKNNRTVKLTLINKVQCRQFWRNWEQKIAFSTACTTSALPHSSAKRNVLSFLRLFTAPLTHTLDYYTHTRKHKYHIIKRKLCEYINDKWISHRPWWWPCVLFINAHALNSNIFERPFFDYAAIAGERFFVFSCVGPCRQQEQVWCAERHLNSGSASFFPCFAAAI